MLDRLYIRDNLESVENCLKTKGFRFDRQKFLEVDEKERQVRVKWEELRALRNRTSDEIAERKREGADVSGAIEQMREVGSKIKTLDEQLDQLNERMSAFLSEIPNLPHPTVPIGPDEGSNRVEREVGALPGFDFEIKDHVDLGTGLGILDPERAAKITGARFANYYGSGARLERGLVNFMLDVHTEEHGYLEVLPPFMANQKSFYGTGNLPKFEADLFRVSETDYYLVPTAEVPVTNLFAEETLDEDVLPAAFAASETAAISTILSMGLVGDSTQTSIGFLSAMRPKLDGSLKSRYSTSTPNFSKTWSKSR